MATNENRFDKEAAEWDNKPGAQECAKGAADGIKTNIPLSSSFDCLEFGCGTGMVSIQILPHVNSIFAIDSAKGMIAVLNNKITNLGLHNITTACMMLTDKEQLNGKKFDLIFSSLVFHHISEPAEILKLFTQILKPGGYIAIVDLEKTPITEDFHPIEKHADVCFHGFTEEQLISYAQQSQNLTDISVKRIVTISKGGQEHPLSLLFARLKQ
eukprot:TRINITY_DN3348_c0_g1_i2.p1 TRINITY_DN3348_c0_g1~~TRINITY_DN3348_c0_g1_i2.p1  ORF type:complete len:213 (+),score=45.92 TRINITY_DN3348_c0_g1_i2:80-718(+)